MADPQFFKYPNLALSQSIFALTNPASSKPTQQSALLSIQNAIKDHKMAPLYRLLAHPTEGILNTVGEGSAKQPAKLRRGSSTSSPLLATRKPALNVDLPWDAKLHEELKAQNEKELESIQKEEDEAVEKAGDTEIQAARAKRAEFWTRVGDKVCKQTSEDRFIQSWVSDRALGQSHTILRAALREDQHPRRQDRYRVCTDPDRPLLRREALR